MMRLTDCNGNIILEREKPRLAHARMTSVRTRQLTKGLKKTVTPSLMSKEEFYATVINASANGNL